MRITGILWNCKKCGKEFELFSDDGAGDRVICWNYCPYCKEKNDVWIRFKSATPEDREIKLGISSEQSQR